MQENYHAAESFAILNNSEFNFLKNFDRAAFHTFRQAFVKIILGTDMAKHKSYVDRLSGIIQLGDIIESKNSIQIIDTSTKISKNMSQQLLLESCVHTADLSVQTRSF